MDYKYANQNICGFVRKSSIRYYKYVADCALVKKGLQKRLASDIFSLYENSKFVDLRLNASGGNVYCHKFIIASRYSCCWRLISEIGKLQKHRVKDSDSLLVVDLPEVTFALLEIFIRSLYSIKVDEESAQSIEIILKHQLSSFRSVPSTQEHRVYLEKLNEDEEREIHIDILNKLQLGEISEKKGNLKVLSQSFSVRNQKNNLEPSITYCCPLAKLNSFSKVISENCAIKCYRPKNSFSFIRPSSSGDSVLGHVKENSCFVCESSSSFFLKMNSDNLAGTSSNNSAIVSLETFNNPQKCSLNMRTINSSKESDCKVDQSEKSEKLIHRKINKDTVQVTTGVLLPKEELQYMGLTSVKAKIKHLESRDSKCLIDVVGNSSFLHSSKQISPPAHENISVVDKDTLKLTVSTVVEDEDSSLSDIDQTGFYDTSSLEVEIPSSQDDPPLSPDLDKSDHSALSVNKSNMEESEYTSVTNVSCEAATDNVLQNIPETSPTSVNTRKPLVRTRTFDLIAPTCDAVYVDDENVYGTWKSTSGIDENKCPDMDYSIQEDVMIISDSKPCQKVEKSLNIESDTEKLRELERIKGSRIFEHNLQTFSNIPSTNGIMSSSLNSESSVIVNSRPIYKSNIGILEEAYCSDALSLSDIVSIPSESIHEPDVISSASATCITEILSNPYINRRLNQPLIPQKSQEEMAIELHEEILKRGPGTRSPSPDSLSLDLPSNSEDFLGKESSNIEEKERDDYESREVSNSIKGRKTHVDSKPNDNLLYNLKSSNTGSPQILRRSENMPIVSGGSTLRKETVGSKEPSPPYLPKRQISCGTVKDVDAIPVVCGYISPKQETGKEYEAEELVNKVKKLDDGKVQSIFSMFINFDDIPSPEKEKHKKSNPTGGMYMFIEADSVSSPKVKRKNKNDTASDDNKIKESNLFKQKPELTYMASAENGEIEPVVTDVNTSISACIKKEQKSTSSILFQESLPIKHDKFTNSLAECSISNKKGGFYFIDADSNSSKSASPKPGRRTLRTGQRKSKTDSNVMSKSAPSDSHLFKKDSSTAKSSTPDSSLKLMTKSVIDRDEFMAQPPARRNVSLNDRINESSRIPRPVNNFKEKLIASQKEYEIRQIPSKDLKPLKSTPLKRKSKIFEKRQSLETSISDVGTSLNVSFCEAVSNNFAPNIEDTSDISDASSLLSSIERSTDPSDQEGKGTPSSLGNDLLKMLLNEINTDVTIQVGESKIRAHKCILASRCVYFAAMLSGHWVESAGNIIKLQGFSAEAVMEALKHIYSGSCSIPEGIDIGELAALADMLALDGLKEVVSLHLKANKCHYFHKPCPECLPGVLEVLPIAVAYFLEELYHKCLIWVAKNFIYILPTRNFASLPSELQYRCLKQIMDDMCVNNVIDVALGAEKIVSSLPVVRWAQPVFDLLAQLIEYSTNFISANLCAVLVSDRFLMMGKDGGWNVDSLEDTMKIACDLVKPDQAVLSHIELSVFLNDKEDNSQSEFSEAFLSMCSRLLNQIEKFIIHNLNRVAVCRKWPLLPPDTQKRIKDAALIVIEFSKPIASKPTLTSGIKTRSRGTSLEPCSCPRVRASSMSDHRLSRSASANVIQPSKGITTKRLQSTVGRCHTPPPSILRASLQTPPPTRASTLRAQARQVAIQRSQSARTVVERPRKIKQAGPDLSVDSEDFISNSDSIFLRGGTITRSISRSEQSFGRPRTPNIPFSVSSRSSSPGISDKLCHKRNASGSSVMPLFLHAHSMKVGPRSSSIEASPLRPSLTQENVTNFAMPSHSKEIKKPNYLRNANLSQYKVILQTQLSTSQVTENTTVLPMSAKANSSELTRFHEGNKSLKFEDISSMPSTCGSTGDLPTGLGCRSNTFCKDDLPNCDKNLASNQN